MKPLYKSPVIDGPHPNYKRKGIQKIYRFENNRGASIISTPYSYKTKEKPWELCPILFPGIQNDVFILDTDNLQGNLNIRDVEKILQEINSLPIFYFSLLG